MLCCFASRYKTSDAVCLVHAIHILIRFFPWPKIPKAHSSKKCPTGPKAHFLTLDKKKTSFVPKYCFPKNTHSLLFLSHVWATNQGCFLQPFHRVSKQHLSHQFRVFLPGTVWATKRGCVLLTCTCFFSTFCATKHEWLKPKHELFLTMTNWFLSLDLTTQSPQHCCERNICLTEVYNVNISFGNWVV